MGLAALLAVMALTADPAAGQNALSEDGAPPLEVESIVLENGMRFLVLERSAAPTVAFVGVVPVGGVNEALGSTGTAHVLEHMLFKGTSSIGTVDADAERALFPLMDAAHDSLLVERGRTEPDTARIQALRERIRSLEDSAQAFVIPNEFDRILTRAGARGLNATTTGEATTYFVELPSNRAELWFALESDRMRDPVFREFYTERDVVMEERRLRIDTNPGGLLYEEHLATAFTMHPYGVPVVGYMSDLETLTRDHVRSYYQRYYGPNNTVVAVVGDVTANQVRRWARRYFGSITRGREPPPVLAREPEQRGTRRVEVQWDAQPALRMGWKVPSALHPDAPALTMLTALLTGGRTAALYRELVLERRMASYVSSGLGPGTLYPRLFTVEAAPVAPHTVEELEEAIVEVLTRFQEDPVPLDDLERVRNQIAAGEIRRLQSNLGLALQLASAQATLGRWEGGFQLAREVMEVTPEEIREVARRYLQPRGLTVAVLLPLEDTP